MIVLAVPPEDRVTDMFDRNASRDRRTSQERNLLPYGIEIEQFHAGTCSARPSAAGKHLDVIFRPSATMGGAVPVCLIGTKRKPR